MKRTTILSGVEQAHFKKKYLNMNDIFENPGLKVLRALVESPAMRVIRAIEDLPIPRLMRDIENSLTLKMIRRIEESPALMAIHRLQESSIITAIQVLERRPFIDAFSTFANRITHGYGELAFSKAYGLLIKEYEEQLKEDVSEPLDNLAESVMDRAAKVPFGPLSAEFYLSLFIALLFFYISHLSGAQLEKHLLKRLDDMEQTISVQLDALRDDSRERIFIVADRRVNLRAGPGAEYDVLCVLLRHQKVEQIETSGEWTKVEYFDYLANEHKRGWVHSRYFIALAEEDD